MVLFVFISVLNADGGPKYRTTLVGDGVVIVRVDKYVITYQMHLMPHVRLTQAILDRTVLSPADRKAGYKFEGTVKLNGKVVATLFRVSAPKFISLASTMELNGDPIISFRSHSAWTRYQAEKGIKIKRRKVLDFNGRMLTVQDTVYTVHTEKTERINMRVDGRRSSYLVVPLETEPFMALWTDYTLPAPKNLSMAWVRKKE